MNPKNNQGKLTDGKRAVSKGGTIYSESSIEYIVNKALKTSAGKMGSHDVKAFINCIKRGDPLACSYCHYNIAKELGEVLGSWDRNIKAVYAYGYDDNTSSEECGEKVSQFSPVHMIVWTNHKTKALNALIESLDRGMTQYHRTLFGLRELEHVLDIQVIDDEEVKSRTGYAALLKSIYQTPVQVWSSNHNS